MKSTRTLKQSFLVIFSFAFLLSSCGEILSNTSRTSKRQATVNKSNDQPRPKLTPKETPEKYRIADLPIPDNYQLNEEKSFIFETANLKTGMLVYNGGSNMPDIVEFYKEEMPKYGWSLIQIFQHKEANMLFEKEDWICNITMKGSWSSNILTLTIAPKDPGSAPPPNQ